MANSCSTKTAEIDRPLCSVGFEIDVVSPSLVSGRLVVTETNSQPFGVLHGGVSALISESLASVGAHAASGLKRVAGIQLSINHHRAARIGDDVVAEARPVEVAPSKPASIGRTIQVWGVQLWKIDASTLTKEFLVSSSRVTLLANLPVSKDAEHSGQALRKYAKL